jgi:hypothetical protein
MSTQQPEALRLADALKQGTYLLSVERDVTAAELRRLYSVNADLLEVLQQIKQRLDTCHLHVLGGHEVFDSFYVEMIDTAIAKATGEQP